MKKIIKLNKPKGFIKSVTHKIQKKNKPVNNKKKKPIARLYGWKKDGPHEYQTHEFSICRNVKAIKLVDLRNQCPPVYDQGELGSCTANGLAALYQFDQMKQGISSFMPSRLFIYYNERKMEGTIDEDAGAEIKDGVTSLIKDGVCAESEWPYNINDFAVEPPNSCYTIAKSHQALKVKPLRQNLTQLKQCLIDGFPFTFGFLVYSGFESASVARSGVMKMPGKREILLGGHAVVCVGYNDTKSQFICRNSWGTSWGDKGYFYMPYNYMTNPNLSSDFWAIVNVE